VGPLTAAVAGWSRAPWSGGVVLRDPAGDGRVRLRFPSPLVRLRALIDEVCAELHADLVSIEPRVALVTGEGEHACVSSARIGAHRCVIGVAGDGPALIVDAVARERDLRGVVEDLVRGCGLGRAHARRRMFEHEPPPGWCGARRHQRTLWIHPARAGVITVFDARPFVGSQLESLDRSLFLRMDDRLAPDGEPVVEDIAGAHGLSGRIHQVHGRDARGERVLRGVAALTDEHFLYLASVEAPATRDDGERAFRALVASLRPVPRPAPAAGGPVFDLWAD
jgi:hypothetical protein